jgi:hypothetical protein
VNNFSCACDNGSGDFVMMLCSDDQLSSGFLKHAVALMEAEPRAAVLSSVGQIVDPEGNFLWYQGHRIPAGLYDGASARHAFFEYTGRYQTNFFSYPSGIIMRGDAYRRSSPFRVEVGDPADVDMWLRCLELGDLLITDRVGCDVTRHPGQCSVQSYKSGRYFEELIGFANVHLGGEGDQRTLKRFRHMLGGIGLGWAVRSALQGNREAFRILRGLGWGGGEMFVAYLEHMSYRVLAKAGLVFTPSLRKISANG